VLPPEASIVEVCLVFRSGAQTYTPPTFPSGDVQAPDTIGFEDRQFQFSHLEHKGRIAVYNEMALATADADAELVSQSSP
jgi:hypothetical protein